MYKTVSISPKTFQELNNMAARLNKPKSQLIDELLQKFSETMQEKEKQKLKTFNAKMQKLIEKIKLPKGTKISTDNLDEQFSALKDKVGEY